MILGLRALRAKARAVRTIVEHPLLILGMLTCLVLAIYFNTFPSSFHFDDTPNIVDNSGIRDLSAFRDVSGSRYIGFLTFALNYHFGQLNLFGYHLVNLLVHITNGFLVYILVCLIIRTPGMRGGLSLQSHRQSDWVALATALLFVAHPIQTQAVTYIVQRFTSLATLFYLLAVVCYVRWRLAESRFRSRHLWYAGALGFTILAMKTKEISFTLPFMLLLVEGVFFRPRSWRPWVPLIPFLLTLPIIPLSLLGSLGEADAGFARETTDISRLSYLCTQFRVVVTYLRLLLFPIPQNVDYDYPIYGSFLEPVVFASFLLLLGLLGLALYLLFYRPRFRLAGFGILWFFLTLAVESSIIPIRDVIFEHRLYLPSVGIMLAGSVVTANLLARWCAIPVIAVGTVVAIMCAVATSQRNLVWKDEVTLWTDVVAKSPKKARAHNSLGAAYAGQERWPDAIQEYTTALRLDPDLPKAHSNLGVAYVQQGRLAEAIQEYQRELTRHADSAEAHNNLGNAYARQGRLAEAIQELSTALQLAPDLQDGHYNLGNAYVRQGRLTEAMQEFMIALQRNPTSVEIHNNLGNVYAQQGRWAEAIQEYNTVLALQPNSPGVRYNVGYLYLLQGRRAEARTQFEMALALQPDFVPAQQALKAL